MKKILFLLFAVLVAACLFFVFYEKAEHPIAPPPNIDGGDIEAGKTEYIFTSSELDDATKERISGVSFDKSGKISYDELRYLSLYHYDFDGNIKQGELIVNKDVADELLEIFQILFDEKYPIHKMTLIDDYDADDEKSMSDNNTSAFCYREIAGKDKLSNHALGKAVDINPLLNPYVKGDIVAPVSGSAYADREQDFEGKITTDDLCYKLFTERGWSWGGDWSKSRDYQHFEKP